MTFSKAREIVQRISHSSRGSWVATKEDKECAMAMMLLSLETRVQKLEAKTQGPDPLKPLGG
jgi:hypothetical protein